MKIDRVGRRGRLRWAVPFIDCWTPRVSMRIHSHLAVLGETEGRRAACGAGEAERQPHRRTLACIRCRSRPHRRGCLKAGGCRRGSAVCDPGCGAGYVRLSKSSCRFARVRSGPPGNTNVETRASCGSTHRRPPERDIRAGELFTRRLAGDPRSRRLEHTRTELLLVARRDNPIWNPTTSLSALRELAPLAGNGGGIVFDYLIPPELLGPLQRAGLAVLAARVAEGGEPFRGNFEPGALVAAMYDMGFRSVRDMGPDELNATYFSNRIDGLRVGSAGRVLTAFH